MEEALKTEINRDTSNLKEIYFFKDGNSPWYRAYELSAYYAVYYNDKLNDNERLKATRRYNKEFVDGIIQIGLQFTSFNKYFPNADIQQVSDKKVIIKLSLSEFVDITIDNYKENLSAWKNTFDLKTKKNDAKDQIKTIYNSPISFTGIMKEILKFDTHEKNENDLRNFIYALKEMCANLI